MVSYSDWKREHHRVRRVGSGGTTTLAGTGKVLPPINVNIGDADPNLARTFAVQHDVPVPYSDTATLESVSRIAWKHARWWGDNNWHYMSQRATWDVLPPAGAASYATTRFGDVGVHYAADSGGGSGFINSHTWKTKGKHSRLVYNQFATQTPFYGPGEYPTGADGYQAWSPSVDPAYTGDPYVIFDEFVCNGWTEYQTGPVNAFNGPAATRHFLRLDTSGTGAFLTSPTVAGVGDPSTWVEVAQGQQTPLPVSWLTTLTESPSACIQLGWEDGRVLTDTFPARFAADGMTWISNVGYDLTFGYTSGAYRFRFPVDPPLRRYPLRRYPRDDGLGLSSAPRLFPQPSAQRVIGGVP